MNSSERTLRMVDATNQLTIDLYHGTSTLFLDSILKNGLGGINPVTDWKLLELSKEVYTLSEQHLRETHLFQLSAPSFQQMIKQSNGGSFNFQHGDTYVSPAKQTAARYAISKRYGSELLTYTIDFLKELLALNIQYVKTTLYRKNLKVFGLIESNPSPLLIQVKGVNISSLLDEHGANPRKNLEEIDEWLDISSDMLGLQQTNFRLAAPVGAEKLKLFLINVQNWNPLSPKYNLYEIKAEAIN
ncbi:hypothetical protein SAMN02745146_0182 [Hymenobacter daecheongensis DSM 21074]|uniref:Uncharacterized protein n=1 Tax=Hymenobacter daecheongensis DSM 21074 TaxID=1121955 RepID=A0A1M6M786_9BACT|nr:hypothetical protein [Hymenobacter daecheongensis]SHJ79356.1 hypothetical protein SAMN02745146_0182 [Hymenobacter daecheongensis DSM 21074]